MLENPAPPSWNFSSPHDKFLQGKILPRSPLPSPPSQQKKFPLKRSVHFQIIITVCKRWSKFVTCSPSPGDCGGVSQPQRHKLLCFSTMLNKMAISKFWSVDFGKNERGRGPRCPPIFWSLKKGTRTFNFRSEWALSRHSRTTWSIRSPLGKKQKKTNKYTPVISLLAKNTKFHIFVDKSLKLLQ